MQIVLPLIFFHLPCPRLCIDFIPLFKLFYWLERWHPSCLKQLHLIHISANIFSLLYPLSSLHWSFCIKLLYHLLIFSSTLRINLYPLLSLISSFFFFQSFFVVPYSTSLHYCFLSPSSFTLVSSSPLFFSSHSLPPCRTIRRSTWSTYTTGLTACAPRMKAPISSSPPLP